VSFFDDVSHAIGTDGSGGGAVVEIGKALGTGDSSSGLLNNPGVKEAAAVGALVYGVPAGLEYLGTTAGELAAGAYDAAAGLAGSAYDTVSGLSLADLGGALHTAAQTTGEVLALTKALGPGKTSSTPYYPQSVVYANSGYPSSNPVSGGNYGGISVPQNQTPKNATIASGVSVGGAGVSDSVKIAALITLLSLGLYYGAGLHKRG
jgi:hypothetical protein